MAGDDTAEPLPHPASPRAQLARYGGGWPWLVLARYRGGAMLGVAVLLALIRARGRYRAGPPLRRDRSSARVRERHEASGSGGSRDRSMAPWSCTTCRCATAKANSCSRPRVKVDWRPFAYLRNHVDVRSATAERVYLRRVPGLQPTPPSDAPLLPDLDIDVGRLKIDRFIAEKPVTGAVRRFAIDGRANIADGRAQVTADAVTAAVRRAVGCGDRMASPGDRRSAVARPAGDRPCARCAGERRHRRAGRPEAAAQRGSGKGDWQAWNGRLDANLAGSEFARLALSARNGAFAVKGPARIATAVQRVDAGAAGPGHTARSHRHARPAARHVTGSGQRCLRAQSERRRRLAANGFDELRMSPSCCSALGAGREPFGQRAARHLHAERPFATPRRRLCAQCRPAGDERHGPRPADRDRRGAHRCRSHPDPGDGARRADHRAGHVAGGTLSDVRLERRSRHRRAAHAVRQHAHPASDRIDAKLVLLADTSRGLYTGAVDGRIDNYRVESVGVFDRDDRHRPEVVPNGFALAGKVRARSRRIDQCRRGANSWAATPVASSNLRYGPDGVVRFANLRLEAPLLRVTGGRAAITPGGRSRSTPRHLEPVWAGRRAGGGHDRQSRRPSSPPRGRGLASGLPISRRALPARGSGYRFDATGDTDYGPLTADVVLGPGGDDLLVNRAEPGRHRFRRHAAARRRRGRSRPA
jgi:translocation and assembly module TamB